MKIIGILLIVVSLAGIIFALAMKTSSPFLLGGELEIPALAKERNTYIVMSVFGLMCGFAFHIIGISIARGKAGRKVN